MINSHHSSGNFCVTFGLVMNGICGILIILSPKLFIIVPTKYGIYWVSEVNIWDRITINICAMRVIRTNSHLLTFLTVIVVDIVNKSLLKMNRMVNSFSTLRSIYLSGNIYSISIIKVDVDTRVVVVIQNLNVVEQNLYLSLKIIGNAIVLVRWSINVNKIFSYFIYSRIIFFFFYLFNLIKFIYYF